LKPIITVYSTGTAEQTKKFEGYISAAFWIGVDHAEGEVGSVKVRQPTESYDIEVATLSEFADLLVERQINFSVEFFSEPTPPQPRAEAAPGAIPVAEPMPAIAVNGTETDYEEELNRIKDQYQKGLVTKRQYESKKLALLKRWKEKVEGKLER